MAEDLPIACSLAGPDMETRLTELRKFGAETLMARTSDDDGHRLRFRESPEAENALRRIVAAEEECCPFLGFELTELADELELHITSSPDGRAVADQLAAAFG